MIDVPLVMNGANGLTTRKKKNLNLKLYKVKPEQYTREELIQDERKFEAVTKSMNAYIKALKAMKDE